MAANDVDGNLRVTGDTSDLVQSFNQAIEAGKKTEKELNKVEQNLAKAEEERAKRTEAAEQRATQATLAGSRERVKQLQKEVEEVRVAGRKEGTEQAKIKSEGTISAVRARGLNKIIDQETKIVRIMVEGEQRRATIQAKALAQRENFIFRQQNRTLDYNMKAPTRAERQMALDEMGPVLGPFPETAAQRSTRRAREREEASIQRQIAAADRFRTLNPGYAETGPILGPWPETLAQRNARRAQEREQASIQRQIAAADKFRTLNPNYLNMRGGGGGMSGIISRLLGGGGGGIAGSIASGLLGGIGVGVGGYAIANIAQGVGADVDRATTYERQTVAARNLAGSQAKLNELLAAYATASGDAVDKVTSLENVTRLMATGFANSAPEIEKFVRATRGASIALGRPQDYVIQETQLAISNISVKRLDQIGLGISEVNERIEQLRKTNAGWTRETAFQDAVISLLDEKYGKLTKTAEGQATGVEKLRKAWADLRLEMGQAAKGPVDNFSEYVANRIRDIKELMEWEQKRWEQGQKIYGVQSIAPSNQSFADPGKKMYGVQSIAPDFSTFSGGGVNQFNDPVISPMRAPSSKGRFDERQQEVVTSFYDRSIEMERNYQEQRTAEIERYESQRLSIVQNYGKMMVREEEDFARQRARGLEDYERSIVKIMKDAQERESEMREALAERIADAREDHEKRVSDIQEKYQEDREKALKDHRDRLMKAAGQLDAIAVLEERKRWKKENEEREEGYKDALEKAQENLDEQIEKANEAHEKQLEKARKADEDRLAEMAENRRIQLEREDEDRGIRLERLQQDHNDQLAELDRLHEETLAKMDRRFYEETKAFEEELAVALAAVGEYIDGVAEKEQRKREAEEKWVDGMIEKYEGRLRAMNNPYSYDPKTGPNIPLDYGKYLNETAPLAASSSHTSNSRSSTLVVNEGAFHIYGAPGQSPTDLAQEVEKIVIDLMEGS